MSSFAKKAIEAIKKHPEIFSALEEFERTKKIPKFTYRKRLDITIDENILRKFKEYCRQQGFNMSRLVEKHILEELKTV
ncbi:hypothetical protein HY837_03635 [archaeon]|nr:hypothetical protein [archaeon]